MATPDGSYALPSGAVAVMKPNEYADLKFIFFFYFNAHALKTLKRHKDSLCSLVLFTGLLLKEKLRAYLLHDLLVICHQNSTAHCARK